MGQLTWKSDDGVLEVTVEYNGHQGERHTWLTAFRIDGPTEPEMFFDRGLGTPNYDMLHALSSVASFLGAWCESHEREEGGENADLYSEPQWRALEKEWATYASEMQIDVAASEDESPDGG